MSTHQNFNPNDWATILAMIQGMGSNKTGRVQQGELNPILDLIMGGQMGNQFAPEVDREAIVREHSPNAYAINASTTLGVDAIERQIVQLLAEGRTVREIKEYILKTLGESGQDNDPKNDNVKSLMGLTDVLFGELNTANTKMAEAQTKRAENDPYTKQGISSPDNYRRTTSNDAMASIAPYLAKMQEQYAPYENSSNVSAPKQSPKSYGGVPRGVMGLYAPLLDLLRKKSSSAEASQPQASAPKSAEQQAHDVQVLAYLKQQQDNSTAPAPQQRLTQYVQGNKNARTPGGFDPNFQPELNYDNILTRSRNAAAEQKSKYLTQAIADEEAKRANYWNAQQAQQTSQQDMMKKVVLMKIMSNPALLSNPAVQKYFSSGG